MYFTKLHHLRRRHLQITLTAVPSPWWKTRVVVRHVHACSNCVHHRRPLAHRKLFHRPPRRRPSTFSCTRNNTAIAVIGSSCIIYHARDRLGIAKIIFGETFTARIHARFAAGQLCLLYFFSRSDKTYFRNVSLPPPDSAIRVISARARFTPQQPL